MWGSYKRRNLNDGKNVFPHSLGCPEEDLAIGGGDKLFAIEKKA